MEQMQELYFFVMGNSVLRMFVDCFHLKMAI